METRVKSTVDRFYEAQATHDRQLNVLRKKPIAKWNDRDFRRIGETRGARDLAVASLTPSEKLKHVDGLSEAEVHNRLAQQEASAA